MFKEAFKISAYILLSMFVATLITTIFVAGAGIALARLEKSSLEWWYPFSSESSALGTIAAFIGIAAVVIFMGTMFKMGQKLGPCLFKN
jgi:hypothetical protein